MNEGTKCGNVTFTHIGTEIDCKIVKISKFIRVLRLFWWITEFYNCMEIGISKLIKIRLIVRNITVTNMAIQLIDWPFNFIKSCTKGYDVVLIWKVKIHVLRDWGVKI